MLSRRSCGFIIGIAVVLGTAATVDGQEEIPVHHFQLPCANCHETSYSDNDDQTRTLGPIKGDINQSCSRGNCHNLDRHQSHPVGVRPLGRTPADLPLDSLSRITCLTCHDELDRPIDSDSNNQANKYFLRRPSGFQFCASCHLNSGNSITNQSHWQFSTRAHLGSVNPQSSDEIPDQYNLDIDQESRNCMSCHDEISGVVSHENETYKDRMRNRNLTSDHPIGMNYEYIAQRQMNGFQPPAAVDQRIRFFDGRLGCGSCHSLYNQNPKHLVKENQQGALCRSCHIR